METLLFGWLVPGWARRLWAKYVRDVRWEPWIGYGMGVFLVGLVSLVIAFVGPETSITDNSILYVLVVVILAALFGRGPAVVTVVVSLLVYDYFFVPPRRLLSVAASRETLALAISVVIALITGQLTASLRARANEARQRERESLILAQLVQVLAACDSLDEGLQEALKLVVQVFHNTGIALGAVFLPAAEGTLRVAAIATAPDIDVASDILFAEDAQQHAQRALREGRPVGFFPPLSGPDNTLRVLLPLRHGGTTIGVVGLGGTNNLYRLLAASAAVPPPAARLIHVFTNQICLAIERDALRQQAVYAAALRESDQMKTALLGSVTHDLRTPLASIKAAATSLLEPETRWDDAGRCMLLQNINEAADRLNRMVGNLLELSRLEAGGLRPHKEWQDIGDVIATTLDRLDVAGLTAHHTVEVDIAPDIPPTLLDYGQIEQVLSNLLVNACKYAPPGTTITIGARLDERGDIEVRVCDEGVGIPALYHEAVFEKFYRAPQPQPEWATNWTFEGTGLGLAICKGIVEMHNGRIWVESVPQQGATFIFTLPVATSDQHAPEYVSAIAVSAGMLPEVITAEGEKGAYEHGTSDSGIRARGACAGGG